MNLNEAVLSKLAEWQPGTGRQALLIPDPGSGWAVTLTADRRDDLGCLLWEVALRRGTESPSGAAALEAWARATAERVTCLMEPLKVVEVDVQRGEALLRNDRPTPRGTALCYYEVLLRGAAEALVRRYHGSSQGGRREQVPFALTHEALARLVTDLATAQ